MEQFSAEYAAVLCAGLPYNSRTAAKSGGGRVPADFMLQAAILDTLNLILWTRTKDAKKGKGRPESFARKLAEEGRKKKEIIGFDSRTDFEDFWKLNGGK